jgi:hypothetical protein
MAIKKKREMSRKKGTKQIKRPKAKTHFKQLIFTLDETTGEVAKLEVLGSTGKRRLLPDAEIAKIAGDDELNDFSDVLEDAYAAGIRDGIDDALSSPPAEESTVSRAPQVDQESAANQILRSGIRRFILRRALRRSTAPQANAGGT